MSSYQISIQNMSCGHCLAHVTRAIHSIPGVKTADIRMGSAFVRLTSDDSPEPVLAAIRDAGYEARLVDSGAAR